MSSVVFVLGAGASRQCGAPLMGDFLDVASDLLRANRVEDKKEQFEKVFSTIGALQAVHSKAQLDLNNIESIFTVLELGRIIQTVPGLESKNISEIIASLKDLIVKTLEVTISFPFRGSNVGPPEPYSEFAELIKYLRSDAFPSHTASVITFNYDIAVDMALYKSNFGPDYVIERAPTKHDQVPLLKLHGSLNWATEQESGRIRPLHLWNYFRKYQISLFEPHGEIPLPISNRFSNFFSSNGGVQVEKEPVIVPPSWNKADYHQALSNVWAAAAKHLSEAEYIFVIGYSLPETDSFFRHLYALGSVGRSTLRKFVVFNPDGSGEVNKRFQMLLGPGAIARYEYVGVNFQQAIPRIKTYFPRRE